MAVITSAQPTRSKELLAYQTLIVREARRCGGRGWLAYDTMFRQQAAGNPEVDWSKLNPTLYAVTFLAQSGSGRNCVLCMESDHSEEDCALAKGKVGPPIPRLPPVGILSEAKWKPQVVRQRGSQGWSVSPGIKGKAPSPIVCTGTPASSVGVSNVLFTAMPGVQIGKAGASRVGNPKAGTLKARPTGQAVGALVDLAGGQSCTGSCAHDFHHS